MANELVSAQTLETVIGNGDLSKLTPKQRVEYYAEVCRTVGLNPLTRPFRFMNFQGQTVLYSTRDCADQLRSLRKIDLTLTEKRLEGDLFMVTARAKTPDGRHDEDVGAIMLGRLQGDARANAIMKCITKAKRRVTLSICGLGLLDETEVETLPNAQVYDAEAETPATDARDALNKSVPLADATPPKRMSIREWMDEFEAECAGARSEDEANAILTRQQVMEAEEKLPVAVRARFLAIRSAMIARVWPTPPDDESDWPAEPEKEPAHA
ncbi:MAG TPA: hypothetical protein VGI78_10885 [Acetobacteraceae bacterium]|jgi:hypothetical protein